MINAAVAPVRPRIISPGSGETFLLEDHVVAVAQAKGVGSMQLSGPHGCGKTTALCHLAATISPDLHLILLDDVAAEEAAIQAEHRFVVFSSTRPAATGMTRKLAAWTDDDFIEYLLSRHPDQASNIFSRIRNAPDRRSVGGLPELWRTIIDEMSSDEAITSVGESLWRATKNAMPEGLTIDEVFEVCGNALRIPDRRLMPSVTQLTSRFESQTPSDARPNLGCLIRHRAVQTIGAAEYIATQLKTERHVKLSAPITHTLVAETAVRVRSDATAIDQLCRLAEGLTHSAPLAASILHACDRGWLPQSSSVNLAGARLNGVNWGGVCLADADLQGADLSASDLSHSFLQSANAKAASFEGATLEESQIINVVFTEAELRNSNLSGATGTNVDFTGADLRSADFAGARFERSLFIEADLRDASFLSADLSGSCFASAEIAGTDFRNAQLHRCDFHRLTLRHALLDGSDFHMASLQRCDLEYIRLTESSFRGANLRNAYLTGSTIQDGDFRDADLRDVGLGEIDWEGADLRKANLTGSSFHMGSTRCGLVGSPYPSEGTRTGFYTDDYDDQYFKSPEEIRKANLRGADLRGAIITGVDFYLVDVRDAQYDADQQQHLRRTGAILQSRMR